MSELKEECLKIISPSGETSGLCALFEEKFPDLGHNYLYVNPEWEWILALESDKEFLLAKSVDTFGTLEKAIADCQSLLDYLAGQGLVIEVFPARTPQR